MKRLQITPLLLSLVLASTAGLVNAQAPNPSGNATVQSNQIKMERGEFLKMYQWDPATEMWVMRTGVQAPDGLKSRAEVKAERDRFLSMNDWNDGTSRWEPISGAPRNMSTMPREKVTAQNAAFLRTHRWDELSGKWVAINSDRSQ